MDAVLPQQHLPQRLASAPGWSRSQVRAEGPFGSCLPAQTPINLLDYPGMASAACVLQSPAALQPWEEFHPKVGAPHSSSTQSWDLVGWGTHSWHIGALPNVTCRVKMPPSKTSAPRNAARKVPASSHPAPGLGGPSWGTPARHLSLSHAGLTQVPALQMAQTTAAKCLPVPSSQSFSIQIVLPAGRRHKEGTFPQSLAHGAKSPPATNISPPSAGPTGQIQAGCRLGWRRTGFTGLAARRSERC